MLIKRIKIRNFRSYYGTTEFEIDEGLTLIVGDNGDGKTTLFEAVEWLFDTGCIDKGNKSPHLISEKRRKELSVGKQDQVKVSIDFEHEGEYSLEKSFFFSIGENDEVVLSDLSYVLYKSDGIERIPKDGKEFDKIFDFSVRGYSMFKGESGLNVLENEGALSELVNKFSELKDFDPLVNFAKYAEEQAGKARDSETRKNKKSEVETKALIADIEQLRVSKSNIEDKIRGIEKRISDYSSFIEDIEANKESAKEFNSLKSELEKLEKERAAIKGRINDRYITRLLDDMWVLCGFSPIAKEFMDKVALWDKKRRKMQSDFDKECGAKAMLNSTQDALGNISPLALNVPGEAAMREMLDEEICKVCGRKAEKGSDAYLFMQQRYEEYMASLNRRDSNEGPVCFQGNYIKELVSRSSVLEDNLAEVNNMQTTIENDIKFNDSRYADLRSKGEKIDEIQKEISKIRANTGLSDYQLDANFSDYSNWWKEKEDATIKLTKLQCDFEDIESSLQSKKEALDSVFMKCGSEEEKLLTLSFNALEFIRKAFEAARKQNKQRFLNKLEEKSNEYLKKLNIEGFTGVIRIVETREGAAEFKLKDANNTIVQNPNTALSTTMYMSVLFAVSELTSKVRENKYPIMFDAPTSSFAPAKEADFFSVVSTVNKQTIIVTKSFLKDNGNVDTDKIKDISASVYRISKKAGYDPQDLATVHTEITKVK